MSTISASLQQQNDFVMRALPSLMQSAGGGGRSIYDAVQGEESVAGPWPREQGPGAPAVRAFSALRQTPGGQAAPRPAFQGQGPVVLPLGGPSAAARDAPLAWGDEGFAGGGLRSAAVSPCQPAADHARGVSLPGSSDAFGLPAGLRAVPAQAPAPKQFAVGGAAPGGGGRAGGAPAASLGDQALLATLQAQTALLERLRPPPSAEGASAIAGILGGPAEQDEDARRQGRGSARSLARRGQAPPPRDRPAGLPVRSGRLAVGSVPVAEWRRFSMRSFLAQRLAFGSYRALAYPVFATATAFGWLAEGDPAAVDHVRA